MKTFLVFLFLMIIVQGVKSTDIVGYSLTTGTAGAATSGVSINYPGFGRVLGVNGVTSKSYTSSGHTCSYWSATNDGVHGWQTNAFSTVGYIQVAVVGQISASSLGPRDLKAQYSLDGSNWINVPDDPNYSDDNPEIVTTPSAAAFKFRLPDVCDNKATVYFRMIQNSTVSQNGLSVVSSSTNTATLKAVVVQAELFAAPTSQASGISLISITPTTITVGCTAGGGNKRILKMNTVNEFTNPYDDYNPSFDANYHGGEQVVFNSSGNTVTVTVPSSLNSYWFRYYEYNEMDELTRYCTVGELPTNPKLCALPKVHTPKYSYGLVNATMGATVEDNNNTDIIDMGVYWSTTPNVDVSRIGVQHPSPGVGVFNINTEVDRGQTIYFRGYAENESGVILSEETSFSNRPVFTGTGNWETPSLWNTNEVPGLNGDAVYGSEEDAPTINGSCTLNTTNTCHNLTVNLGKSLIINPATALTVTSTITNNAGNSGIIIKSSDNQPNGSLVWTNGSVQATVQMYSKAYWDTKYHWQYFGTPVSGTSVGSVFSTGSIVRKYDETNVDPTGHNVGLWDIQASSATLFPVDGYEVVQQLPVVYNFKGTLNHGDFSKDIDYTGGADWAGNHILSNPHTAAIDISSIDFGLAEEAVYIYNTGSYLEWQENSGSSVPGSNPGTYSVSTSGFSGIFGIPAQIPSMQGFLIKTNESTTINIPYSAVVENSVAQRVKTTKHSNTPVTIIDIVGQKNSDRLWLFPNVEFHHTFDNGFDGRKMLAGINNTQIFASESDGDYQINAVDNFNSTMIAVQPGNETTLKLVVTHQNNNFDNLYLLDLIENKTVDISEPFTEYTFNTEPLSSAVSRFKIVTFTPTLLSKNQSNDKVAIFNIGSQIYVNNKTLNTARVTVFSVEGTSVLSLELNSSKISALPRHLQRGVYLVKVSVGSDVVSSKVIIN